MSFYNEKKILVAGGTGLIGRPLVEMLINKGAKVRISSLDDSSRAHPKSEFRKLDLTDFENCKNVCEGMDYVFNLLGAKGSPKLTKEKPANFFDSMILFNTNLMRAAKQSDVKYYLFTSTIGVYSPAEIFYEDDVWKTFPSENDRFGGWAKRMGELQARAYEIQYDWNRIAIVRPANVYGEYDNFDLDNGAMVIPSLIKRVNDKENPLVVWGDGTQIRDFIHATDVAKGMMLALEKCPGPQMPINLGSGQRYTIKDLTEVIAKYSQTNPSIVWDKSKPSGDKIRVMDISRAKNLGWQPEVSLEQGIKQTIDWYNKNKAIVDKRYNIFGK